MTKNRNLVIFSEVEKFALYGLPDFDNKQRREYFSFSENELSLIRRSQHDHINIYCALQIAYFKAKKMFFQFLWKDIQQEDLQFIIDHYFQDKNLSGSSITNHEYYNQRKAIATLFGYQLWSKEYLHVLYKHATEIIKRDTAPNFIARELMVFLDSIKLVRPGYTVLQTIVSKSLSDERKRISSILDKELTDEYKLNLDKLMVSEDSISKLTGFRQDAKNFGFKMMLRERQKYDILEPFYNIAKDVIPKLEISKQNMDNYVNLANHYSIRDLRELKHNQNYLYILCYVLKRYQQLNDNLVEAFIYHIKRFKKNITDKVKSHFVVDESTDSQEKIGNLLLLYVDDKQFSDISPFSKVRDKAFEIMPKENIQALGQKMLNKTHLKKEFKWQEIDKVYKSYRKILRPLFMKLDFSSEAANNQWLKSANWLQQVFTTHQKLSNRPFIECPDDTIPKYLEPYLIKNNTKENKTIIDSRYEYRVYCQINKQLSTGGLYIKDSINHRCFNHELVAIAQKEEILKKLNIPWLQQPIDKQLNDLSTELHYLWRLFNKTLKQDNLDHLKYDAKKKKLFGYKTRANQNEKLQSKFFKQVPICEISNILNFVNDDCNFLSAFTPLQPRYSKQEEYNKNKLIATILAQAFNHGNYKMSEISDISYRSLETTYQQYLRLSTLRKANDIMSNAISKLKIFPYYSLDLELLYGSVDGQKFELDTPNIKARHSRKYLREGQGVSAYTSLANHIPLQCQLIGSHEHESYFVFDIWYNNTSEIIPEVITGDMHSINKANFAIMKWFGAELNPRFTSLNDQLKNLFCANDIKRYDDFLIKPVDQIDLQVIIEQKGSIDQLVATLALKEMNQANLIKKICHLPPENNLRKAVFEYDKLIRSIYTLKYMMDIQLQKTIHKSQNRIEAYHQLRAAIAKVGGKKQLYGKTDIDIEISNQCGRLIALSIIYYNSIILSGVLEKYEHLANNKRFLAMIRKISPIAWHHHIHFLGQYTFQNKDHAYINIENILKNINLSY
jgi:TnpA family transposase